MQKTSWTVNDLVTKIHYSGLKIILVIFGLLLIIVIGLFAFLGIQEMLYILQNFVLVSQQYVEKLYALGVPIPIVIVGSFLIFTAIGFLTFNGAGVLIINFYRKSFVPPKQYLAKVFISYAWTNEQHKKWVINLAESLQRDRLNVVYDENLRAGQDNTFFMKQVYDDTIDNVLIICTSAYKEKADKICDTEYKRKTDKDKSGVEFETEYIVERYNKANVEQQKFLIPIIRQELKEKIAITCPNCGYHIEEKKGEQTESAASLIPESYTKNGKMPGFIDMSDDSSFSDKYQELVNEILDRKKTTFYEEDVEIIELKFYSGENKVHYSLNKDYRASFKRAPLKFIHFEIRFKNRVKRNSVNTVMFTIRDENGNVVYDGKENVQISRGEWGIDIWYGYDIAGQWAVGQYLIRISLKNSNTIERSFSVID